MRDLWHVNQINCSDKWQQQNCVVNLLMIRWPSTTTCDWRHQKICAAVGH